jgi:hypothetical protein
MNHIESPHDGNKPCTQQQQPQAAPSTGRGADSALAVLKKRRIPIPGEQPHGMDRERPDEPRSKG